MPAHRFTPWLTGLVPQLVELLNEWTVALGGLVDAWAARPVRNPEGEPDGLSGLARRGSWERLSVMDWAVALDVPEEFLRRATEGELLFQQLERVQSTVSPITWVAFEDGPLQQGAPRLVHLALGIVLGQRALEAGGELQMCAWSAPAERLVEVADLLDHRASRVEPPEAPPNVEVFWVGSRGGAGGRTFVVEEDGEELVVRLGAQTVRLQRPDLTAVARLLQHPRKGPEAPWRPPERHALSDVRVFNERLFLRHGEALSIWPLPKGPRLRTKPRVSFGWWTPSPGRLVAAGWAGKAGGVLFATEDELVLELFHERHTVPRPADFVVPERFGRLEALPRRCQTRRTSRRAVLVRDGANRVWLVNATASRADVVGEALCDPCKLDGIVSWVSPEAVVVRLLLSHGSSLPGIQDVHVVNKPFGTAWREAVQGHRGEVALRGEDDWWVGWVAGWASLVESSGLRLSADTVRAVRVRPSPMVWDGRELVTDTHREAPPTWTHGATWWAFVEERVVVGFRSGELRVGPLASDAPWLVFRASEGI